MLSKSISLDAYAARLARKLGLAVGLALAAFVLAVVTTFAFSYYRLVVEKSFTSHIESFSFWLQVNDRFQMQRALAGIVENQDIGGAIVVDNMGEVLAKKGDAQILDKLPSTNSLSAIQPGLLLRYQFMLRDSGSTPEPIGKIIIGLVLPYTHLSSLLLGSIFLVLVAMQTTKKSFVRIAKRMTRPVHELAANVARTQDLAELHAIDRNAAEYSELQLLMDKISEMSERLVHAEKTKEILNLSRQVAHDIRSPLSALRMTVGSASQLDSHRRDLILRAAERIDRIAEDLLQKSRGQSEIGAFEILPACQEIIAEKNSTLKSGEFKIELEVQEAARSLQTVGDRKDFQRLLSNLINNSIEAATGSGHVRITVKSEDMARIEISDDGAGIPDQVLSNLNYGLSVTTKVNGNGLGISHARRAIEAWGGELNIQSQLGIGTTVSISLVRQSS